MKKYIRLLFCVLVLILLSSCAKEIDRIELKGLSEDEAIKKLEEISKDFKIEKQYVKGDKIGIVEEVIYSSNLSNSKVVLHISESNKVSIDGDEYIGKTYEEVEKKLREIGLKTKKILEFTDNINLKIGEVYKVLPRSIYFDTNNKPIEKYNSEVEVYVNNGISVYNREENEAMLLLNHCGIKYRCQYVYNGEIEVNVEKNRKVNYMCKVKSEEVDKDGTRVLTISKPAINIYCSNGWNGPSFYFLNRSSYDIEVDLELENISNQNIESVIFNTEFTDESFNLISKAGNNGHSKLIYVGRCKPGKRDTKGFEVSNLDPYVEYGVVKSINIIMKNGDTQTIKYDGYIYSHIKQSLRRY